MTTKLVTELRLAETAKQIMSPTARLEGRRTFPLEAVSGDDHELYGGNCFLKPKTNCVFEHLEEKKMLLPQQTEVVIKKRQKRPQKGGWKSEQLFDALDDDEGMARTILKNKQADVTKRALTRRVLKPSYAAAMKRMPPDQCDEFQKQILGKIDKVVTDESVKLQKYRRHLDARGVFDPETNAHRVHARFLTSLQKKIDVASIEDECLRASDLVGSSTTNSLSSTNDDETMTTDERPTTSKEKKAKRILFGLKTGAGLALASRRRVPKQKKDTKTRQFVDLRRDLAHKTARAKSLGIDDTKVFDSFTRWQAAREKLASPHTAAEIVAPLAPPTPQCDLFQGQRRSPRLVKPDLADVAQAASFENIFLPSPDVVEPSPKDDTSDSSSDTSEAPTPNVERRFSTETSSQTRRSRQFSISTTDFGTELRQRLDRLWRDLDLTTVEKLSFLQKYATMEDAPLLPRAVDLWEMAAIAYRQRTKLLVLRDRVTTKTEVFTIPAFLGLVRSALENGVGAVVDLDALFGDADSAASSLFGDDDASAPSSIGGGGGSANPAPPDDGGDLLLDAGRAEKWIDDLLTKYDARLLEVSEWALTELGDIIPERRLSLAAIRARQ